MNAAEKFVQDMNAEIKEEEGIKYYIVPPKSGNYFGIVFQSSKGIGVQLCDDNKNPIMEQILIFSTADGAENHLRSRENPHHYHHNDYTRLLIGDWNTIKGEVGLVVHSIVEANINTNTLNAFVKTLWKGEVKCTVQKTEPNDGQNNCGIWYKENKVLKCLTLQENNMKCIVMEKVTPVITHIFEDLLFKDKLAHTTIGRPRYNPKQEEIQAYIDQVKKLNDIRMEIAKAVHNFHLENPGKAWLDFKLDNVGLYDDRRAVLLDEESGIVSSTTQVLPNIENWGVNGQYCLLNLIKLDDENQKLLKENLTSSRRISAEAFVKDMNAQTFYEIGLKYYVVPPKSGNFFGMVFQWDTGIRVQLCDDNMIPIWKESKIFFDSQEAENYLRSRENP